MNLRSRSSCSAALEDGVREVRSGICTERERIILVRELFGRDVAVNAVGDTAIRRGSFGLR
jgi:hypothetical protein